MLFSWLLLLLLCVSGRVPQFSLDTTSNIDLHNIQRRRPNAIFLPKMSTSAFNVLDTFFKSKKGAGRQMQ